ncbi:MAG: tRNA guanosine(34) transglycosylase Tgt, partial [Chloroflexota bacterium]|nr:tRNA guanosine(34) transglycosylase Tgt [Chloroflexota bacterium]
ATPAFMPVASQGSVKSLSPEELTALGAQMLLANAYHLYLRPGAEVVRGLGGLHRFMGWSGPILTDSGGFQVFSLGHLRRLDEEGILFRSHLDGSQHLLTPEKCIQVQEELGADIIMALDECPPYPSDEESLRQAVERTERWAERCLRAHRPVSQYGALFGIVQGGTDPELRRRAARGIASLGFAGYGLGGLSLGEPKELTWAAVRETVACLPPHQPRYLMGVGSPEDLWEGVSLGVDLFDCVLPTRVARNGSFFTREGRRNIRNAAFAREEGPLEPGCDCYTCRTFSAAYLHHLFKGEELLAYRLATIHNLRFIMRLMEEVRLSIGQGSFPAARAAFLSRYRPADQEARLAQKEKWQEARRRRGPFVRVEPWE